MSPVPPAVPIEPSPAPRLDTAQVSPGAGAMPGSAARVDAFRAMLDSAGSMLSANPAAIGRALLSGLNGFSAHEGMFRAQAKQAMDPKPAPGAGDVITDRLDDSGLADGGALGGAPAASLSTEQLMQKGDEMTRQSMSVMMQTYSFAVEAQLVTNAATTFTSSINTLIKTQ